MNYDIFYAGAGTGLLGAMLGAWLTFRFQRILLKEELEAQEKSQKAFLDALKEFQMVHAVGEGALHKQIHIEGQAIKEAIQDLKSKDN
jgi:hypothetical protein